MSRTGEGFCRPDLEGLKEILGVGPEEEARQGVAPAIAFDRNARLPVSGRVLSGTVRFGKWDLVFPPSAPSPSGGGADEHFADWPRLEGLIDSLSFEIFSDIIEQSSEHQEV